MNLRDTDLFRVDFIGTSLARADFRGARCAVTTFANLDLSAAEGLEEVVHVAPSHVDISSLYKSNLAIPTAFLLGVGFPDPLARSLPAALGQRRGETFCSSFISFSSSDEEFASMLHRRMREAKLRVWFAPEDIRGGAKIREQIERAIQDHDKLLLVLSERSIQSAWVATELRRALENERTLNKSKLFPIRLVDHETIRQWSLFDTDSGEDLATLLREYHILDFSGWRDPGRFEKSFGQLLEGMKAGVQV